jgi:hypothetical protein
VLFPGMADLRSEQAAETSAAAGPARGGAAAPADAGPPKGTLPDEDVTKKAAGTFAEFVSIRDYKVRQPWACLSFAGRPLGRDVRTGSSQH